VRGLEVYDIEQFRDQLERKDLVRELLAGDPLKIYAKEATHLNLEEILASGAPPEIELVGRELAGDSVRLTVRLFNNAGGGIIKPFLDHTPDTLRTTIDRNLWTTLWCTWHAVPIMKAKGYGRVVNIGADSVRNGLWDHAAYNAAKGGVHAMVTGLAREFAKDGITFNVVAPCIVNTPQVQKATIMSPQALQRFVDVVPMGRAGEMDEIASMVCYLASREASFVTGQVISVNGGSTML